jgi:hypothetical protein
MVYICSRVDDGYRDAFSIGDGVGRLDVRAGVDPVAVDRGRLEMPLLRKNGALAQTPHQFGVAVLYLLTLQ